MADVRFAMKHIPTIFIFISVLLLSGCGTIQSKAGFSEEKPLQIGHVYSGVAENLGSWCVISNQNINPFIRTFNAVFMVIDLPLSVIGDTVLVPIDLVVTPKYPRSTAEHICNVYNERC